jgi:uncharacterized MAPEG superfamily protein
MDLVVLVIALALAQFIVFAVLVGRARGKYGVNAPAVTGHEVFERYFRVQQNTLELLVVFVPATWLFAQYVSTPWAAGLGALYLIGRTLYLMSYVKDPKKRGPGFGMSMLPIMAMVIGVLFASVQKLLG